MYTNGRIKVKVKIVYVSEMFSLNIRIVLCYMIIIYVSRRIKSTVPYQYSLKIIFCWISSLCQSMKSNVH